MSSRFNRWFILLAISFFMADTIAADLDTDSSLEQRLAYIKSISGQFVQQSFDSEGVEIDASEGSFSVAKTAKLLWHVRLPIEQKIISNGSMLWIYDPDLDQVVVDVVDSKINSTPMGLFTQNPDQIDTDYTVVTKSTETIEYHLTAKNQSALFKVMVIRFIDEAPVSISLIDSFNQKTDVTFSDLDLNVPLDDSTFEFSIPNGIDVIRNDG